MSGESQKARYVGSRLNNAEMLQFVSFNSGVLGKNPQSKTHI